MFSCMHASLRARQAKAGARQMSRTDWRQWKSREGLPVEVIVPGILAVLLEDGQQLSVLHDQLRMLACQRKPLAALAPMPPQLVAHTHSKPPRVCPLLKHKQAIRNSITSCGNWNSWLLSASAAAACTPSCACQSAMCPSAESAQAK